MNSSSTQIQAAALLKQAGPMRPVALLYADLDRFKAVNDRWGHARGDQVLQAFADALRQRLRGPEAAARLGGDEFAVLLQRSPAQARAFVQDLDRAFSQAMRQQGLPVSASVGCSGSADAAVPLAELLRRSDRRMYQAKQRRKLPGRRAGDRGRLVGA
jgi:diguanylate cyclase (GGDEF)-like protein